MNDSKDGCLKFRIGWVVWIISLLIVAGGYNIMAGNFKIQMFILSLIYMSFRLFFLSYKLHV